jgi:hypothetical protein
LGELSYIVFTKYSPAHPVRIVKQLYPKGARESSKTYAALSYRKNHWKRWGASPPSFPYSFRHRDSLSSTLHASYIRPRCHSVAMLAQLLCIGVHIRPEQPRLPYDVDAGGDREAG